MTAPAYPSQDTPAPSVERLVAQRDELVAALRAVAHHGDPGFTWMCHDELRKLARAALAKAGAGQ